MGPDFCTWFIDVTNIELPRIYSTPFQYAEQAIHEAAKDCKEATINLKKKKTAATAIQLPWTVISEAPAKSTTLLPIIT